MRNINFASVENFIAAVREIVYDVIKNTDLRIEKYYDGIVSNVDSDDNVVSVNIGDIILEDISNKTGTTLAIGDTVRVYAASSTLADAYVGTKLN